LWIGPIQNQTKMQFKIKCKHAFNYTLAIWKLVSTSYNYNSLHVGKHTSYSLSKLEWYYYHLPWLLKHKSNEYEISIGDVQLDGN